MNQVLYFPQGVVYKWRLKGDGYQGFCGIKVTKVIIVQSITLEGRGIKNDLQLRDLITGLPTKQLKECQILLFRILKGQTPTLYSNALQPNWLDVIHAFDLHVLWTQNKMTPNYCIYWTGKRDYWFKAVLSNPRYIVHFVFLGPIKMFLGATLLWKQNLYSCHNFEK